MPLCQHEDLLVDRFELLHPQRFEQLAEHGPTDIARVSPETEVRLHLVARRRDPWDFEEVYGALHDFARAYPFDAESEDYLVHITTGTHVAQICLFLLTESRHLPGRACCRRSAAAADSEAGAGHAIGIIDLDLSHYDRLASRFAREQRDGASLLKSGIATRNARVQRARSTRIEHVAVALGGADPADSGRPAPASRCSRGASTS